jgi:hypothetical protein
MSFLFPTLVRVCWMCAWKILAIGDGCELDLSMGYGCRCVGDIGQWMHGCDLSISSLDAIDPAERSR